MSRHPFGQSAVGRKIVATGEDCAKTAARVCCKQSQKIIGIPIHITEKGEIKRVRAPRQTMGANIVERLVIDKEKTREMQHVEFTKRYLHVVLGRAARCIVHVCEQLAKLVLALR